MQIKLPSGMTFRDKASSLLQIADPEDGVKLWLRNGDEMRIYEPIEIGDDYIAFGTGEDAEILRLDEIVRIGL